MRVYTMVYVGCGGCFLLWSGMGWGVCHLYVGGSVQLRDVLFVCALTSLCMSRPLSGQLGHRQVGSSIVPRVLLGCKVERETMDDGS